MAHGTPDTGQPTRAVATAVLGIILVIVLNWAYTTYAIHEAQVTGRRQGEVVVRKLCTTLDRLHAAQPPPGNPATNPSRAYLQILHDRLGQLPGDIGC